MTAKTISKSEAQAQQPSQDTQSQDNIGSIPVIEGIESSLETLYTLERNEAHRLVQTVRVAAYKDEFQDAIEKLKKGQVSPDFFSTLQKNYTLPSATPSLSWSLIPSGLEEIPTFIDTDNLANYDRQTLVNRYNYLLDHEPNSAELDALDAYLNPVEVAA